VEFLADIWSAAASILGKQREVLPLLTQAAETRQNVQSLQAALEIIAVQCGEADVALLANGRQPTTDTGTLRRVVELHMARRDRDCVRHFEEHGSKVSPTHPHFGFAVSTATMSADRILRPDLVERWRQLLSPASELAPHQALLDYFLETSKNALGKEGALTRLEGRYEALGKPLSIAMHVFHELDAGDRTQAATCVELGRRLESERMLHAEAVLHQAQALATLGKWDELLDLSRSARGRFEGKKRFIAVEALALDRLGKSAEAMSTLKSLIAGGDVDTLALNTYINIVVRCGFTEEAIESVEKVLSTESQQSKQVETLRLLFSLVHLADPFSGRGVNIAWRLGQIVSRDDEAQEGLFLILMLTATLHAPVSAGDPRLSDFQQRLEDFTTKYPTSKILRSAHVPQDASSEQVLRMLREIAGLDEERLRWREKVERQLQHGAIAIPYAWRPRQILMNIPDLPTLWAITKASKPTDGQYHLLMVTSDWKPESRPGIDGPPPLLDLVALLVVSDLKIFDYLFEIFPQIAVGQGTLLALMQLTAPMSGSPLRKRCIELQNELKTKFTRIAQPSVALPPGAKEMPRWDTEEVRTLARGGRYRLYSDDAIFRAYCEIPGSAPAPICSLDVLNELDHQGILTVRDVAEKYSMLCNWHVGLQISLRYQVAALPDALGSAKSVSHGIDILRATPSCVAIFDEIWDPRKPYAQFVAHGVAVLRALASDSKNKIDSVSSLLGLWWGKARLRNDAPQAGAISAQLIMSAVGNDPPLAREVVHKLWSVYRALIALEHGDRMDVEKERQAIVRAGQFAANVDHKMSRQGSSSLYSRAVIGLTAGTSDADTFQKGYQGTLAELAKKSARKRINGA
jgi:hypothetical protein